jgi:hypothetical protein
MDMFKTSSVGIPLLGNKLWPSGAVYIKSLVKAVATLSEQERPQLFLIVTDDTLQDFSLYAPLSSLFNGVIYFGKNPDAAQNTLGSQIIHCPSAKKLFDQIDYYFPASSSLKTLGHKLPFGYYLEDGWYRGNPQEIQQQYGLPDRFIFCCNPCWIQDGHLQLFKTLAILKRNGQYIHLVGEGFTGNPGCHKYLEDFRQYFKELAIEDLVHILDPLPEIERIQLIRHSLFVVQPATFEGLPSLIQLCQALGKPVILSDPELCRRFGYGIFVEIRDQPDFATQIAKLAVILEPGPNRNQEADAYSAVHYRTAGTFRKFVQDLQKTSTKECRKRAAKFLKPDKKKPIPIATSIFPRDLNNQREAIDSWLNIGFQVVSFNGEEEMSALRPHFPDVEFVIPEKTAEIKYGKPFIYLEDILDYFDHQDIRICGIVNSDIHFRNSALYDLVVTEAVNSLVYGARVEVTSLQEEAGIMDIWGFDYFFFDKHFIPYFPAEDFCLGIPWWDFWIPLILLGYKLPVKRIVTPHAYHEIHPRRYDDATLFNLGYTFAKYVAPPFPLTDQTMTQYSMYLRNLMAKCSLEIVLR